jgi:Zn-dependent protease
LPGLDIAQVFIAFIVLLFSLTVHESAHAWTADRLGDPTARLLGRVSLNPVVHADLIGTVLFPLLALAGGVPLIGWAKPVPVRVSHLHRGRRDYVLVAAAGPASNLVLAVVAAVLLNLAVRLPIETLSTPAWAPILRLLVQALQINVLLAVFNMIPIPPLDGGNVLSGLLPGTLASSFDRLRPYGFIILYGLLLTRGFDYVVIPPARLLLSWLQ